MLRFLAALAVMATAQPNGVVASDYCAGSVLSSGAN